MYTPNNSCSYAKAFAGAMAGLGASGRYILDASVPDALRFAQMADAYAQQFDTTWGASAPTGLEEDLIFGASMQVWINNSPLESKVAFIPGSYTGLVNAAIALVQEGNAQVVAEGIDPNACTGLPPAVLAGVEEIRFPLALVTASSVTPLPANARVNDAELDITTPYSPGTTISIGQGGSLSAFQTTANNDPSNPTTFRLLQDTVSILGPVVATVAGAPVAGAAIVIVRFVRVTLP